MNNLKLAGIEVSYVDHMGSDVTVVNAARVSFNKCQEVFEDKDEGLIRYLAEHNHWSPFAHTTVQLRVKAPIFLARQLVKHQVGGVWNEVSRRYVSDEPEFWLPDNYRLRPDGSIKQGSGEEIHAYEDAHVKHSTYLCLQTYEKLLADGVAPELARIVLPQNTMTEWIWSGSLVFWARVYSLRADTHAQKEAQDFAHIMSEKINELFPVSWKHLTKQAS